MAEPLFLWPCGNLHEILPPPCLQRAGEQLFSLCLLRGRQLLPARRRRRHGRTEGCLRASHLAEPRPGRRATPEPILPDTLCPGHHGRHPNERAPSCRVDIVCMNVYIGAMKSADVIAALAADGWVEVARKGSHAQFRHPSRPGRVTVPHPKRDIPVGTLKSIEKQSGLKLR